MFILTKSPDRAAAAMRHLCDRLPVSTGPIHRVPIGDRHLLWCRAQVRDNLHVFSDGVLIARRSASEQLSDDPQHHGGPLPSEHPPALPGTVIRPDGTGVSVEPLGVTSAYTHGDDVSDRTLLLAAMGDLRPSPKGTALLAGVGYFPGDLTLFDEVRRVPFLHRWCSADRSTRRVRTLSMPRADDEAMVERLASIVPVDVRHAVGLSGGHDSRFVLGILRRAGADVRVVRFQDRESDVASALARQLDLEVQSIGSFGDHDAERTPAEFTAMTDGQIWHGVAQFGRLRQHLAPDDVFDSGQFSPSMNKNTLKTAWKKPDPRRPFWDRLVHEGFVRAVPAVQPALRSCARREELFEVLDPELRRQLEHVDLGTRKQTANWLYYMNRGMRWAQAYYDDLGHSANVLFLLSDVEAQLLGLASGAWGNFHNDRFTAVNRRLLPDVDVPYSSGAPAEPPRGPAAAVQKVRYEYLDRWKTSRTARARLEGIDTTYEEALPEHQPKGHEELFDRPMHEVAHLGQFGLRRANVTVSNVLAFLESVPALPEPGTGPEEQPDAT